MRSLRARLTLTYVVLALALLGAMGWVFSRAFVNYAQIVQEQQLRASMVEVASRVERAVKTPTELETELQAAYPDLDISFERVIVTKRTNFFGRQPLGSISLFSGLTESGERVTGYSIPYQPGGLPVGSFFVTPRAEPGLLLRVFYQEVVLLVGLGVTLAALAGWWLSRWLARPIARLTQATGAVAEGDFLQTVKPTGTPELDGLVQQFNRMVQRLDESFRSLSAERDVARRFASDAAHELKTPLTALKAYHETAADRPERVAQVLPGMGRSITRIEGIITGLLQLARLGEGTGIELTRGDAAEVLAELEPTYRAMARDAGLNLTATGLDQPLPVRFDPHLLEIAVTNLVSNACKFTPAGGEVRLDAQAAGGEVAIAVTDTGRGIAPDDLGHIFERFHRGTDTQTIPGSGLGLSIVQEAVGRMGGRVTVESEPGKGSRFTVRLPLASSERMG
ncbi:MAG TPA: HAMP domain-containing sensor histidine kinase [Symbiobacteriaceae bacterium]|nr:HAMP domain-containing sensor histidine kinase [Symbiobacteriaceae bacterium]